MSSYFILNILTVAGGVIMVLIFRDTLKLNLKALAIALICVSIPFIVWDSIAATRGDWAFSAMHTFPFRIWSLPIEEILFFPTTGFTCIILLLLMKGVFKWQQFSLSKIKSGIFTIVGVSVVGIILGWNQYYTVTVMGIIAVSFLFMLIKRPAFLYYKAHWYALILCFVPFLIVNTVLTALPIVTYSPNAFSGIRLGTIPLEDFFFNFIMLFWYFGVYTLSDTIGDGEIHTHQ